MIPNLSVPVLPILCESTNKKCILWLNHTRIIWGYYLFIFDQLGLKVSKNKIKIDGGGTAMGQLSIKKKIT